MFKELGWAKNSVEGLAMVLVSNNSLHAPMPPWCGMLVYNEVTYIVIKKFLP